MSFTCKTSDSGKPLIKIRKTVKGKRVTVLSGIAGDRHQAVTTLKHLLGVGGELSKEDFTAIELQGDQTKRLESILQSLGAIPKPVKELKVEKVAERKKKQLVVVPASPDGPVSAACKLVHGNYWPYCNGDCTYCLPLTDVFEGLEMFCDWYDGSVDRKKKSLYDSSQMTKSDLDEAFESLGLRASVGNALLNYQKEKAMRFNKQEVVLPVTPILNIPTNRRTPVAPVVVHPKIRKSIIADKPVRIILNRPRAEVALQYPSMEISLLEGWISEYQSFIASLIQESGIDILHQELEDSNRMCIQFETNRVRDDCVEILHEVMPNFFNITTKDPEFEEEMHLEDALDPSHQVDMFMFQRLAADLGLAENEEFWEHFCLQIDDCENSEIGIMNAFQFSVLHVTHVHDIVEVSQNLAIEHINHIVVLPTDRFSILTSFDQLGIPPPPS